MKTRPYSSITASELLLGVMVLVLVDSIFAQSGRVIPPLRPTPPPTEAIRSEAKLIFTLDPNAEKYKLVFATSYQGKGAYPTSEKEALNRAVRAINVNFVEQLNQAGAQGYRFMSSTRSGIALMKLEDVQYEYAWFSTSSTSFFAKTGFETAYSPLAKQGFRVIGHKSQGSDCDDPPYTPNSELPELHIKRCVYDDLFLLTRVKGRQTPHEYRLAQHIPKWRELTSDATLTTQINEDLLKGFYPTHAFSRFEVLLQPASDKNLRSPDQPEVKVVTGDVRKKVNEWAQQGYRLVFTNYEIAVMARNKGNTTPVSYVWLDAMKKNFAQQLAQLQDKGAIYRSIYPSQHEDESHLVFEQPAVDDGTRREYKVLKFEIQKKVNTIEERVSLNLTPASKETLKTLNQFVKDGFEVRNLFKSDNNIYKGNTVIYKVSVLLERSR